LVQQRLAAPSDDQARDRAAVISSLKAAASFLIAEELPETDRREARASAAGDFRAGLEALGPSCGRYLGRAGGLGEIAREVLGDAALLKILDETSGDGPESADLLSVRAESLYHARRYQEAEVAARRAWELSGRRDNDAFALLKLSEGRTTPSQGISETSRAQPSAALPPTTAGPAAPIVTAKTSKSVSVAIPEVPASGPDEDASLIAPLSALELEHAAYSGLREAVAAAPMPVSAARSAFDRPSSAVERDLKLRRASQAAAEWLSRSQDPQARTLLTSLNDPRRKVQGDALSRASQLLDRTTTGREDARIRSILMGEDAEPEARAEAARSLLALRRQAHGYFKAKAAALDYIRFNREHLADFPAGTRFSGAELGMEPPPDSGLATIEYETTKDGRLVAARLVSTDGSSRERAEAAGAWTVRDKSGKVTGWTLDAGTFAAMGNSKARGDAVAGAVRWLTAQGFTPGGRSDQAEAAASLLGDLLGRPDTGVLGIQIYADRAEGRLIVDADYGHAVKQSVTRFEPGETGQAGALVLYERTVTDPRDATTPWRKSMLYRGAGEREFMATKAVSNGEAFSRAVTGTSVDLVPIAIGYQRDAVGRWKRDGRTREFPEQGQVIHDSAGAIGGAVEILDLANQGVTDLTASALAAGGALALYPARALPQQGNLVAEIQQDLYERAGVNFVNNRVSVELGERYQGAAYKGRKAAMNLDERKYVQNVRQELTEQGHPMLGAVAGAGVGFANSMLPMAAGLGALHGVAKLNVAGELAARGVGLIMSGTGGWDVGIAANEFNRARTHFDARDPRSVADYYTAVQDLTEQSAGQVLLLAGLREVVKAKVSGKPAVASLVEKPSIQPAQLSGRGSAGRAAKLGNDRAVEMASKVIPPETGYFDVVVHGSPNSVSVNRNGEWIRMDHRALARFITKQRAFDGSAIRLLSCQAGACDTGIAKNLANKLGVPVKAPTGILYVRPDGSMFIGRDVQAAEGVWKVFTPGKAQ